MEKLIELLNEYEPYIASDGEHRDNLWGYAYQGHSAVFPKEIAENYIISKSYGFIKWLVENEKIDCEKVRSGEGNGSRWHFETVQPEYYIIMLLSIQDEPINFLISILK